MKISAIRKISYFLFVVLGMGLFSTCNDNINDYTKTTGSDASNDVFVEDSVFNFSIERIAGGGISGADTILAKFPVYSSLPAASDINVTLDVDNDLIAVYNAQHTTGYMMIPSSDWGFGTQTVTIPKGETCSPDSIAISYRKNLQNLSNTNGYLIPLKIRSANGADVKIRYEERTSYIVIDVTQ